MASRPIFPSAALLLFACTSEDVAPPIPCGPNGECPSGYTCEPKGQKCVKQGGVTAVDAGAMLIGAAGGTVYSADSKGTLVIPAGALDTDTAITVTARAVPADARFVGNVVYDLLPADAALHQPVTITFAYDPNETQTALRVALFVAGGVGTFADSPQVDTGAHTITAKLSGLGSWGTTSCATFYCLNAVANPDASITVTWSPGAVEVRRAICTTAPGKDCTTAPSDDQFTTALPSGGSLVDSFAATGAGVYWYRVLAGASPAYAHATITTPSQPPAAAQGFTATANADGTIALSWDQAGDATGYVLSREVCGVTSQLVEIAPQGCTARRCTTTDTRALGLAPGATYLYHLVAQNGVGPGPEATASAKSMVATGECLAGTLELAPSCNVALPSGMSAQVEVQLTRGSGPGDVELHVEPSAADAVPFTTAVQTVFDPTIATGTGGSTATFTDAGLVGRASAIVCASAAGSYKTSCSATPGACWTPVSLYVVDRSVPVTLTTYAGSKPGNAAWVAARAGSGPWQTLTGANGSYPFTASTADGGRYSLAVACFGAPRQVQLFELTTSETQSPVARCGLAVGTVTLSGFLKGLSYGGCADVTFANFFHYGCAGYDNRVAYMISSVPPDTYDFVATTMDSQSNLLVRLALAQPVTVTNTDLDFEFDKPGTITTVAQQASVKPGAYAKSGASVSLRTPLGTLRSTGSGSGSSAFPFRAVPLTSLGGSLHQLAAYAYNDPVATHEEQSWSFFAAPTDVSADLSVPLAFAPTVTLGAAMPYARPQASFDVLASAAGYVFTYLYSDPSYKTWAWTVFLSPGWLAGSPPSYELPDLSSVSGFDPSWGFPTATGISWSAHADRVSDGGVTALLQLLAGRSTPLHDGFVRRWVTTAGTVP
jgi:hypothetical protein